MIHHSRADGATPDRYLITGGAGFIGTNLAAYHLEHGRHVTIADNFTRPGSRDNASWLRHRFGGLVDIVETDVRRPAADLTRLVADAQVVFHLAAQVAVTTSVLNPVEDFEINARGTLNVLEAVRHAPNQPILVFSSTNKVYGSLSDVHVHAGEQRYVWDRLTGGIDETRPLDFHSPYGCSKGSADQYVLDYCRLFGVNAVVFRQSCIYGPHQFGIEDQGWVAWFAIRALQQLPVTIFGDGKQVRDILYVADLIDAYTAAVDHIEVTSGKAYNIGGGPTNTLSLLELIPLLERQAGSSIDVRFDDWRPGDQRLFVSDITRAERDFGWRPRTDPVTGLAKLLEWLKAHVLVDASV